jgi:hypothetical protein
MSDIALRFKSLLDASNVAHSVVNDGDHFSRQKLL